VATNLPSLLQAATSVSKQATMATVKTDSLILVVLLRESYTADVSFGKRLGGTFLRPASQQDEVLW
jgi:hypothetical protein